MTSDKPLITYATPRPEEAYRFYLNGKIAIRELNSGILQFKYGDREWESAE